MRRNRAGLRSLAAFGALAVLSAAAGEVEIVEARVTATGAAWRFEVTLAHGDTGWDHSADAWRVVAPDGTVLGTRTLFHPHVEAQPFTRSLSGVAIPGGIDRVVTEALDSVHGWASATMEIALDR
ncbi:MAG: hypothetical protein ACFBSD_09375 [Paracoccaceae bacterium]